MAGLPFSTVCSKHNTEDMRIKIQNPGNEFSKAGCNSRLVSDGHRDERSFSIQNALLIHHFQNDPTTRGR